MTERLSAEWEEQPFTSIRRRRETVKHRIIVETFESVGVDIRHEVKTE